MARALAPVKTGELRDSIEVETEADGSARVIVGAAHGLIVEFGGIYRPAHPFFIPAIEAGKRQRKERMGKALKR